MTEPKSKDVRFSSQPFVSLQLSLLGGYLEDRPMTCKWLISMVSKSPNSGRSALQMGVPWLINMINGGLLTTGSGVPSSSRKV